MKLKLLLISFLFLSATSMYSQASLANSFDQSTTVPDLEKGNSFEKWHKKQKEKMEESEKVWNKYHTAVEKYRETKLKLAEDSIKLEQEIKEGKLSKPEIKERELELEKERADLKEKECELKDAEYKLRGYGYVF